MGKTRRVIKYDNKITIKIYKNNSNIELWIDVIYINGVAFQVSIDEQVKYISTIHISSQNKEEYFIGLDKILQKYNSSGLTITIIHADSEFKPWMNKVKGEL